MVRGLLWCSSGGPPCRAALSHSSPRALSSPPPHRSPSSRRTTRAARTSCSPGSMSSGRPRASARWCVMATSTRPRAGTATTWPTTNQLMHVSETTGTPTNRVHEAGVPIDKAIAENIAMHHDTAQAEATLEASAPHLANILNPRFTHVGLASILDGDGNVRHPGVRSHRDRCAGRAVAGNHPAEHHRRRAHGRRSARRHAEHHRGDPGRAPDAVGHRSGDRRPPELERCRDGAPGACGRRRLLGLRQRSLVVLPIPRGAMGRHPAPARPLNRGPAPPAMRARAAAAPTRSRRATRRRRRSISPRPATRRPRATARATATARRSSSRRAPVIGRGAAACASRSLRRRCTRPAPCTSRPRACTAVAAAAGAVVAERSVRSPLRPRRGREPCS